MPSPSHPRLTRVNGIGLWNSWTRNFKTPLLALLDLLDNSVDAAFVKEQSEPEGTEPGSLGAGDSAVDSAGDSAVDSPDASSSSPQPHSARQFHGKIHIDADKWNGATTGLKIVNNSSNAIKDLGKIMEVYSSSKGRLEHGEEHSHSQEDEDKFAESIGENGVGLKQGCATLSDLSFVLTRASDGKMGMAVIAQCLQTPAGVYLPHIYFNSTELQLLKNEMRKVFSSQLYSNVGECVAQYGDGSLDSGIDRLLRHFAHLNKKGSGEWGEESNVFCVILHQLKHGRKVTAMSHEDDDFVEFVPPLEQQYSENAHYLMQELQDDLPRNYIHINMEVRVGGKDIHFFYWQRRLAELTEFFVNIDENHSYMEALDWDHPAKGYPLRIFCGFDSVRLTADQGGSSCSLNIYSRFSGRLIKHEEDARALLKLPSGGTDYSQGLTIVVDDMLGNLPLNPTKQDVAFGEQAHGDVHKRNIFAWLGAIARLYYKHHLETKCNGKKTDLTRKVKQFGTPVVDLYRLKLLDKSEFTGFDDLTWQRNDKSCNIFCSNRKGTAHRKGMTIKLGEDTIRRFSADKKARKPAQKRKRAPQVSSGGSDQEDQEDILPLSTLPKRRRRAEVNYNEDDALEVEVDADVLDDTVEAEAEAEEVTRIQRKKSHRSESLQGDDDLNREEGSTDEVTMLQAQNKSLQEEIEALRDAVKKHKEKSHERKKLVRQIDGYNKQLKRKVTTLEAQASTNTASPKCKSSHELQLEEQVDQLTDALTQRERAFKELEEKNAALKKENSDLKREKGLRQEEHVSLTMKLEEVTNQLVNAQGQHQDDFVLG